MHTPLPFARLCAAVVLLAPLSLLGAMNEAIIRDLKLTKYVEPEFPHMALFDGLAEGHVTFAISRTPAGEPVDVLVLSATNPRLAAAAVAAAHEWRFQPTNDPAELATRTVRIGFKLQGVVIYPFGKNVPEELTNSVTELRMRDPVHVPRLQALANAPRAVNQPMPAYPLSLRPRALEGKAAVRFYVDEEGRVRLPEVVEATSPEFADAALTAVSQWRYEPPQAGGRPIVASDHWAFQFKANN